MEIPVNALGKSERWVAAALFALCVAPTFISYQPYVFRWDDSDYLQRSIAVSRGFWSGNAHAVRAGMVGIRPPVMTLLGLPWGPLDSWDAAGKCFITLAAVTSLLAASCLYLLLRIGVKPVFLIIASVCVFASIGPLARCIITGNPFSTHVVAVAFMADSLFAWMTLAAILLIPYEARTYSPSIRGRYRAGHSVGGDTFVGGDHERNFFYFIVFIVPILFLIRLHHGGLRGAFAALYRICWLVSTSCHLLASMGTTRLRQRRRHHPSGVSRASTIHRYGIFCAILFENRRAWCFPSC